MMLLLRRTDLPVHSCALLSCFFLLMPLSHLRAADAVHGLPAKIELHPPDIVGKRINVQPDLTSARAKLESRAASTAVIDAQSYRNGRVTTAVDALGFAPGVLAQSSHGDEARFPFGARAFNVAFMRGIELYQDGIPLNHADGSDDFQSIEPLAAKYIEVWQAPAAWRRDGRCA